MTAHAANRDAAAALQLWSENASLLCAGPVWEVRMSYNVCLHALSTGKMLVEAESVLLEMERRSIEPDQYSYHSAMACGRDRSETEAVADRMRARGIPVDAVTMHTLLRVCIADGDSAGAERAFREFTVVHGVGHTLSAFNTLAAVARAAGDFGRVLHWCGELQRAGLRPDAVTHGTFIMACADKCTDINDEYGRLAVASLERAVNSGAGNNAKVWGGLIELYARLDLVDKAEALRSRMLDANVSSTSVIDEHLSEAKRRRNLRETSADEYSQY
eukprot:TRINITY_DN18001_c0_g1_i1.p1 TRINITY_DN18001_c0_g1~~TRINITY_DN18001_c0_g1_i1.p1  ORF type:complete len:274 (+),score=54.55 TRINITY_DN18001_c0_g1_i1:547-1368(+)